MRSRLRRGGKSVLLGVPIAVFLLVFGGSLAWFAVSDEDDEPAKTRARRAAESPAPPPPPAPTAELPAPTAELPVAKGPGWILFTLSPNVDEPAAGFLARARIDAADMRPVTKGTAPASASDVSPALSPDGRTVAFQRSLPGESPRIHLVRLDGTGLRPVTRGKVVDISPAWSPDGKRIAFARRVRNRLDLFSSAADGSGLVRLTRTPQHDEDMPAWSPDGKRIAFTRFSGGQEQNPGELWVMDSSGGDERQLLGPPHDHQAPSWSPDGSRLALIRDGLLAVSRADGSGLRHITPRDDYKEMRPSWSPDGSRIVFTRDPRTILVVEPDGADLERVRLDAPASDAVWATGPG